MEPEPEPETVVSALAPPAIAAAGVRLEESDSEFESDMEYGISPAGERRLKGLPEAPPAWLANLVKCFWLANGPLDVGGCVYLLLLSIQGSGHLGVAAPWQCSDDGELDDGEAAELLATTQWAMFFLAVGAWTRKRLLPPLSSGVSESASRRRVPEVISNVSPAEGAVRCTACAVNLVAVYFFLQLLALVFGEVGEACADAAGPGSGQIAWLTTAAAWWCVLHIATLGLSCCYFCYVGLLLRPPQ